MIKTYEELITIPTFEERFRYLKLNGSVGSATFGSHRYLNQMLYRMREWKILRNHVILRDEACDLAHPDFELNQQPVYIHHINPITIEDLIEHRKCVFDLNNLITCSFQTHQAIHYGDEGLLPSLPIKRSANDTCPWR